VSHSAFLQGLFRRGRRSEGQLQKYQVEPAPEFESHLMETPHHHEAQTLMQADGGGVFCIHPGDHDVLAHVLAEPDELDDERPADARTAAIGPHMDAVLNGVSIARPSAKLAERPEPHDSGGIARDDEWKPKPRFSVEPDFASLRRELHLRVDCRGIANDLVVDREDLVQLLSRRRNDLHACHGACAMLVSGGSNAVLVQVPSLWRSNS
jgi:hypothetical protein